MRVYERITIGAPPEAVWEYVADPGRYLHFFSGVTRWEVEGEQRQGLGSRYRMLLRVGSAEIGGLIETVEWNEPREIAWVSVTGIDQRGRWRLRECDPSNPGRRTKVELRLAYGVAGSGPLGWLSEQLAAPTVRGHLRRTLQQLKRQVEQEQLRAAAAARREARAQAS
jgi:uncharacterized membrane protein